jgi:cytochrome c553
MRLLKWIGIVLLVVVLIVVLAGAVLINMGNNKFNGQVSVPVESITVPTDEASLARGEHLAHSVSPCVGCHGENLGGGEFINEPSFAVIYAPNLTPGQGGAGATYTDEDWVRAIRHGVAKDGRALFAMPSRLFYHMSDADLGALIAYLKTIPPVDNQVPPRTVSTIPVKLLLGAGMLPLQPDMIDHDAPRPAAPEPGVTTEYGQYLTTIAGCMECHGDNLAGAPDPNAPQGPNLTPGGPLAAWTEDDFITAIRTGVRPGGVPMDPIEMPWPEYMGMTDDELKAIWMFLQSQPALPTN